MCRRGTPEVIRSDNGGNFVGAEKELRMIVQGWNRARITESLRKKETIWIFNPPASPHIGGVCVCACVRACVRACVCVCVCV